MVGNRVKEGMQFYLLFFFLEISSTKCCFPSFWCTYSSLIDRAHSTWLCAIICIPVISFLEIKCENPGFSMRYILAITWEEFSLFQTSFFHYGVVERSFLSSSYHSSTRFTVVWDTEAGGTRSQPISCCPDLACTELSLQGRVPGSSAGLVLGLSTP